MTDAKIRFGDAAGYDEYMGPWSRSVGDRFLDWLALGPNLRWLDVGCGGGAFTERIVQRATPTSVDGIDPSDEQIGFVTQRDDLKSVRFRLGDAMDLPFQDDTFDVAVMPLVIFFVPDPYKGVAEMARVVRPGGTAAAYGWDLTGGGFPYAPVQAAMADQGMTVRFPPSKDAAELEKLRAVWAATGVEAIETRVFNLERSFASLDAYWSTVLKSPNLGPALRALSADKAAALKARIVQRLPPDAAGRLSAHGRAHAIKGRVPA